MHTNFAIKKPALHLQCPLAFNIHELARQSDPRKNPKHCYVRKISIQASFQNMH